MKISRRTFILSTRVVVAAPAFADLFVFARTYASPLPASPQNDLVFKGLVFRIDGWSACDPVWIGGAPPACEEVWIAVSRSLRTTWR